MSDSRSGYISIDNNINDPVAYPTHYLRGKTEIEIYNGFTTERNDVSCNL